MKNFPKPVNEDFVDSRFMTANEKRLTVQAVVNFLKSGLNPAKFNKRAYHFFHQTLSMMAHYDIDGFKYRHFQDEESKARFLSEVQDRINSYAMLDPERNSDMAEKFSPYHDGRYAELIGYEYI